jgi:hypothetical protein
VLEEFTDQTFDGLLGQRFEVVPTHGHPFVMELTECRRAASAPPPEWGAVHRHPFSLLFHTRPDVLIPQQICRLRNPRLGEFPLFIVPLGPDARGMRYEAVLA